MLPWRTPAISPPTLSPLLLTVSVLGGPWSGLGCAPPPGSRWHHMGPIGCCVTLTTLILDFSFFIQ